MGIEEELLLPFKPTLAPLLDRIAVFMPVAEALVPRQNRCLSNHPRTCMAICCIASFALYRFGCSISNCLLS